MDTLPDPATMTDEALLTEWQATRCEEEDQSRADALAAEMDQRQIEY